MIHAVSGPALLNAQQHVGLAVQPFEVVEGALFLAHDVHDDIAVVHQHPAAVGLTFNRRRPLLVQNLDRFAHVLGQSPNLPVAVAGRDDEVIGNRVVAVFRLLPLQPGWPQVKQQNILRLFVFQRVDNRPRDGHRIQ